MASGRNKESEGRDGRLFRVVSVVLRIVSAVVILALGLVIYRFLTSRQTAPVERAPEELVRTVQVMRLSKEPVALTVSGYGTARPARSTDLSAEVRGRVIAVRDDLQEGNLVKKGELLVQLDSTDYEVALDQVRADVIRLKAELKQLEEQEKGDQIRLAVLKRDQSLAEAEYKRIRQLFEDRQVGSEADKDRSEQAWLQRQDAVVRLRTTVALYPSRTQNLQAQLARAQAQERQAAINLQRCNIRSPWDGRVLARHVDIGEVLTIGQPVISLADDQYLEVPIALNSDEVLWALNLREGGDSQSAYPHWFQRVDVLPDATLCWVDDIRCRWQAKPVRIERYDPQTRTLTLVLRPVKPISDQASAIPLITGMFCQATIAGRTLEQAVVIPRAAIQMGGNVLVVDSEGRAYERRIRIAHNLGNRAVLESGLAPGERLVASRISGIIDGMKVRAVEARQDQNDDSSSAEHHHP